MFRSYWKPTRRREGWLSYLNQKLSGRQIVGRQQSSIAAEVVHPGLLSKKITTRFESTVAGEGLLVVGQELLSQP
jgi:hypothetical protein